MGRKRRILYILTISLLLITVIGISSYVYAEFNGVPWRHAAIKKEAVVYMKQKYNMDVEVVGSSYNFKFDYYKAKVYNLSDTEKQIISVERAPFYDENGLYKGERLEDNYSKIYWEKRLGESLQEKFPSFFKHNDIAEFKTDIAYFTSPLESSVSAEVDENGHFIPLMPANNCILDVELKTSDFSEEFINELLHFIEEVPQTQLRLDLFITGKDETKDVGNNKGRTKLIELPFEQFKDIDSIEDIKQAITEF